MRPGNRPYGTCVQKNFMIFLRGAAAENWLEIIDNIRTNQRDELEEIASMIKVISERDNCKRFFE